MLMEKERLELVRYGKKLLEAGLTKGTGGNLSIYNKELGLAAITPSGIDFFETEAEDIVIVDLEGNIKDGIRKPSSEKDMHLLLYREREDITAVIHAHTVYATVLACLREDLPATHYMIACAGESVKCAEYASFGTYELAMNACKAMEGKNAAILANHGIIAGSCDLLNAFNIIEEVEYCSKIYVKARSIGNPVILPHDEMAGLMEKFKTYGQKKSTKERR